MLRLRTIAQKMFGEDDVGDCKRNRMSYLKKDVSPKVLQITGLK